MISFPISILINSVRTVDIKELVLSSSGNPIPSSIILMLTLEVPKAISIIIDTFRKVVLDWTIIANPDLPIPHRNGGTKPS